MESLCNEGAAGCRRPRVPPGKIHHRTALEPVLRQVPEAGARPDRGGPAGRSVLPPDLGRHERTIAPRGLLAGREAGQAFALRKASRLASDSK